MLSYIRHIFSIYSSTPLQKEIKQTINRLERDLITSQLEVIEAASRASIIQSKLDYLRDTLQLDPIGPINPSEN